MKRLVKEWKGKERQEQMKGNDWIGKERKRREEEVTAKKRRGKEGKGKEDERRGNIEGKKR